MLVVLSEVYQVLTHQLISGPLVTIALHVKDGCFIPGDKYVVVDSGGGTVDLTVHQIRLPEGHLKELYKATGEPLHD